MLSAIIETDRFSWPRPHGIAVDGNTVYVSTHRTGRIEVLDRESWSKTGEIEAPGTVWAMTYGLGGLAVTYGRGEDDNRFIARYKPGEGWTEPLACPDDTGSHLGIYGGRVLLGQWYNKQLLLIEDAGGVIDVFDVPHEIAGLTVHDDAAYLLTTDDEEQGEYWITRFDLKTRTAEDVATVPFHARSLAFDGERFWTNDREGGHTITFTLPS